VRETDDISVLEEAECTIGIKRLFAPGEGDDPFVVVIFVVVTSNLLLLRTDRIRLDMRVKQASSVANIFQGDFGSKSNL